MAAGRRESELGAPEANEEDKEEEQPEAESTFGIAHVSARIWGWLPQGQTGKQKHSRIPSQKVSMHNDPPKHSGCTNNP